MPDDLYWFDQILPAQRSLVGDKAFYLALLQQRGYPVIPGVVMPSSRFRQFLQQIDWRSPLLADLPYSSLHVDVDQPLQLQTIAQQIRQGIQAAIVPEAWLTQLEAAVQPWRSSVLILRPSLSLPAGTDPTVSPRTKGLLQAQVCGTSRSEIGGALKQVWSELFRAKSLLYWQRLGIQLQQINLAVLVQPLWGAIASGEASILTNNSAANHLEIKATYGLGMALTQGEMLPDLYQIEQGNLGADGQQPIAQKLTLKSYAYQIASAPAPSAYLERCPTSLEQQAKPVLNSAQLEQLAQLTQHAIASLETVLDFEWVLCQLSDQPKFYLTQAIPQFVGAFSPGSQKIAPINSENPAPLSGIAASPGVVSATAWVVSADPRSPFEVPSGAILVASQILPEMLVGLNPIAGILTEQGGMTSHGAILARELGIPAVVGLANATRLIRSGESLRLDGDRGWVQIGQAHQPSLERSQGKPLQSQPFQNPYLQPEARSAVSAVRSALATVTPPRTSTAAEMQIYVSLSQTTSLAAAAQLAVAGVGLLRSDLLRLEFAGHPPDLEAQLTAKIQQFAAAFAPRPVFYRSQDERSPDLSATNPALGMRGTFSYQLNPDLFELELAALRRVQQQGYDNLRLILPFVRTVEDFSFCRQRVIQAGLTQVEAFQLWIMAEVPSVLLLLPDYVKAGVQGIAIGTNDLTQLLLGVDRDHPQLSKVFTPQHPAVLRAIQLLVQTAKQLNLPCHLCGQPTPALVEALIEWGIDGISVEPSQVEETWRAILQRRATPIE
jgi:pyruvate, water dikinase